MRRSPVLEFEKYVLNSYIVSKLFLVLQVRIPSIQLQASNNIQETIEVNAEILKT